ncbi:MAG: type I 3-dehydroquinate dehydratase [Vicinamibacterales bacterium]
MTRPIVCETVTATSMAELRAARDRATGEVVELRLDGVRDVDVAGALEGRRQPVVVTCRAAWEGGRFDGDEETRLGLLASAVRGGAEFVDVEWRAEHARVPRADGTRRILSSHDFSGLPADLAERVRAMRATGDIVKVAVQASRLTDCITLRDAVAGEGDRIVVAMGPAGWLTRVAPERFGSCWTFAGTAAPGQLSVADLVGTYRVGAHTPETLLYGVTGRPLAHSASPAMHNAAFAAVGADALYVPFETDDPDDLQAAARAFGIRGLSVTAPLKAGAAGLATKLGEAARRTGVVNTLRFEPKEVRGENFDVAGFLDPIDARRVPLEGRRAVVLGAGGAARAAAMALASRGARVAIAARRRERALALARSLDVGVEAWPPAPGWDLLVNATPVGTWPDVEASPLEAADLAGALVYDMVYHPRETALRRRAAAAGIPSLGGLDMLVGQARRQFAFWTGHDVPAAVFEGAALAFLASRRDASGTDQ